ncbi:MAG: hypothetical protein ACRD98_07390 [Nitrososphaera sp.]
MKLFAFSQDQATCRVGLIGALIMALGGYAHAAASQENVTVRHIGRLDSVIAHSIRSQVNLVRFTRRHDSPILFQGETMSRLKDRHKQELKATYQAGHTIVLLDATMQHIRALHGIIGEGVNYRSKDSGVVMAYALRRENHIPTATLLTNVHRSPLRTPSGDPDPTGLQDDELAFNRAADLTVTELRHMPKVSMPGPPQDPNQPNAWQDNPLQTTTFKVNGAQGVYNTAIDVYALHRCLDGTDHYTVTAEADWTATQAKWQGASSEEPDPTMFLDNNGNLVINWQDTVTTDRLTYCTSPSLFDGFDAVCRYINYPLSYDLTMVPRTEGTVTQIDAAPAATQGQQSTYTSGFSFNITGTVNVSAMGPGGGISAGATWSNTTSTTVPPLIVEVQNAGPPNVEGVDWTFEYCTTGLEPDPGTDCTNHVQMVKDVCQAQLGDTDSGTNPQQGQTPVGKFSNAVQSAHWQTASDARVGSTFDIEVDFEARIGTTIAHLGRGSIAGPDPIAGCNASGCACVSDTQVDPVSTSHTFEVPFPSTKCE